MLLTPPPLETLLKEHIRTHGPLTVEEFMRRCLYDDIHGYYTLGLNFTDPASPQGRDFTTAPELTPLFGATLAHWVHRQWKNLGQPSAFSLVEAGPGRGTLMLALLQDSERIDSTFAKSIHPVLIETSHTLTKMQQNTLHQYPHCRWGSQLSTLNNQQPTILIANELLDAFPVCQFAGEEERTVLLTREGTLAFSCPDEAITHEDSPAMQTWLSTLKSLTNIHSALLIDYGNTNLGTRDTLQALHRHQKVSPLFRPGDTDLTAHVNFSSMIQTLSPTNCTLTDLTPFLLSNNLLNLAEPSITTPQTASALHRLLHPDQMGSLFKTIEYRTEIS